MKMIELQHVTFAYETKALIEDLSFSIEENESVGLIGANGAGKSTILKLILGSLVGEGSIYVNETLVSKANQRQNHQDIGYLFQNSDHQMFMPTVYEDLLFGLINNGISREEADARIDEVLKQMDIERLKDKYNHKISVGEKRMAAIATILAMRPKVLLMDEPTTGLDPYNRRQVIQMTNALQMTKLITSHDLDMIYETCDKVLLINNGKIQAFGDTKEILQNKKLLEDNRLELPLRFQGE